MIGGSKPDLPGSSQTKATSEKSGAPSGKVALKPPKLSRSPSVTLSKLMNFSSSHRAQIAEKLICTKIRDGPNTTTTTAILFACPLTMWLHGTSDEKSLCPFCIPLCRRCIWCGIREYPKMKNAGPRDELENGRDRVWVVPYKSWVSPIPERTPKSVQKCIFCTKSVQKVRFCTLSGIGGSSVLCSDSQGKTLCGKEKAVKSATEAEGRNGQPSF